MKNIIFYFSGTGNTLWAAKKIAEQMGNCELISIADYKYEEKIRAERVGIFFPIYYWGLPNIIKKFASNADIQADYLFELHTMGGYDGIAVRQLTKCLDSQHEVLSASFRIQMPNNISLLSRSNLLTDVYRIPGDKQIMKLIQKAQKELQKFAHMIKEKEAHQYKEPVFCKPWHKYGYQLNEINCGQFHLRGKEFNQSLENTCTGCGKCSKACPVQNITMESGKPVWGGQCEFCLACLHTCPVGAINYGYSKGKRRYQFPCEK